MAVEALKSVSITNLDASPISMNTAGEAAPAYAYTVNDYVTISPAASAGSTYRILRVPSYARMKSLVLESEAMGAGKVNCSVYYSDSPIDNNLAGVIVPTTGDQFFASDVDLTSALSGSQIINESGNNTLAKRNMPLWQALGLSTDPGGFFDIVLVVHTTDITTGAARAGLRAEYVG